MNKEKFITPKNQYKTDEQESVHHSKKISPSQEDQQNRLNNKGLIKI